MKHSCGADMKKEGFAESGRQRWKCTVCNTRSTMTNDGGKDYMAVANTIDERLAKAVKDGCKRFIVTSATNNSGRIKNGWESLKQYSRHLGAELIVMPVHYKNVSAYTGNQEYRKWWAKDVEPHIVTKDAYLGGGVQLMVEKPIQATAVNPLSGMQAIGGNRTCIYGHPQIAMMAVPAPASKMPKRIWTTGSVTQKNYSSTKAGAKGQFHHTFGALMVEVVGKRCFIRVLGIDGKGEFYDLDKHVTPNGVTKGHSIDTLTTGDEHELFMCPKVKKATYTAKGSIVNNLKPSVIVRHDILDGYAGSHHHIHEPLVQFRKHHLGLNDYRAELDRLVKHLDDTTPKGVTNWIVPSNHHDHLDKWLTKADANKDHVNSILISELQMGVRKAILAGKSVNALELYLKPRVKASCKFLDRNKPAMRKGIDHSQHGDVGANGSRGSAAGIAKTTHKATIGHSHTACIEKSVYQVGTSTGRLEYERGLSSHTNTHVIQYANGKRTIIDIIDGEYCA